MFSSLYAIENISISVYLVLLILVLLPCIFCYISFCIWICLFFLVRLHLFFGRSDCAQDLTLVWCLGVATSYSQGTVCLGDDEIVEIELGPFTCMCLEQSAKFLHFTFYHSLVYCCIFISIHILFLYVNIFYIKTWLLLNFWARDHLFY